MAVENPWIHGFLQLFSELLRDAPTEGPLVAWHAKMEERRLYFLHKGQELGVVRKDLPTELLNEIMHGVQLIQGRSFMKRYPEMSPEERENMFAIMHDLSRRILLPSPPVQPSRSPKSAERAESQKTAQSGKRKNTAQSGKREKSGKKKTARKSE
jgi:hypothetical protein